MVKLIKTIDSVARERLSDVIFIEIFDKDGLPTRDHPSLREVTSWLSAEGFNWQVCAAFQSGWLNIEGGARVIFIDAKYEPGSLSLERLDRQFEKSDGSPRINGLVLTLLTLTEAMTNAEQDEPGFWERF